MSEELHESGCQEAATCRYDVSKDPGSACSGDGTHEVEIEEADGSSKQKEYDFSVSILGSMWP